MIKNNYFSIKFSSLPQNEAFARSLIGAFMIELNPTLDELEDVKTAISEAVTNSIVHAYNDKDGEISIVCSIKNRQLEIIVEDFGLGIENIDRAMEPFFTTKPEDERSGMGLPLIKSFMDNLEIISESNTGTKLIMTKILREEEANVRSL